MAGCVRLTKKTQIKECTHGSASVPSLTARQIAHLLHTYTCTHAYTHTDTWTHAWETKNHFPSDSLDLKGH